MIKKFRYKKDENDITDRVVFVTSPASDCDLGIDLSDLSEAEVIEYSDALENLRREYVDGIRKLGLANRWRKFKTDKMV